MPKQIRMPKLSDTMEEGTLLQWRKREGDPIRRGEILADIETDKADMEFESYTEGTVARLLVSAGTTVPIGTPIAVIALPGESLEEVAASSEASATTARPAPAAAPAPSPVAAAPQAPVPATGPSPVHVPPPVAGPRVSAHHVPEAGRLLATPRARRMAEEKNIDLSELKGSGPAGAVLAKDVEGYLEDLESQEPDADGIRATPVALRMASELGLDLDGVKGSGPGGRISKSDLEEVLDQEKRVSGEREAALFRGALSLSQKRKALVRNMVRSKAEAPHFYISMDVQTDPLKALRDRLNEEAAGEGPRLTYTHLILKACALALEKFPEANATFRPEENSIGVYEAINIGIAVDVHDELVAPTVKDCQGKSIFDLAEDANRLIQRARMRKLSPDDYADGTFTISNLGMFGVDFFYAIITPPQSAILSVASIQRRAVVRNGEIVIETMTTLGLSVDHRVLDGVKAAQLLGELKRLLESPEELVQDGHQFGK
ncbi:MAG: dihydrolipoamide acetyltransferase family protein [Myxococcota bacterium]